MTFAVLAVTFAVLVGVFLGCFLVWVLDQFDAVMRWRRQEAAVRAAQEVARQIMRTAMAGRSPIRCGRHPGVPGGFDHRQLVDGLPVGWYCPACRCGRSAIAG